MSSLGGSDPQRFRFTTQHPRYAVNVLPNADHGEKRRARLM